jgi:hypothetical protein
MMFMCVNVAKIVMHEKTTILQFLMSNVEALQTFMMLLCV